MMDSPDGRKATASVSINLHGDVSPEAAIALMGEAERRGLKRPNYEMSMPVPAPKKRATRKRSSSKRSGGKR